MIDGLKVTIAGDELSRLCKEQAQYHEERADAYERQIASMRDNKIEGNPNYTNGDPIASLEQRRMSHANQSRELRFIAKHLMVNEYYNLGEQDLRKIGIIRGHGF